MLAFYFFFKYRARRADQSTPMVLPSVKFEIAVIGVPLFFFLLWFVQGFKDYIWYTTPPKNTMDVYVMGKKWMWKFAYAGGGPNAIGVLHVPANRPVRLLMTSRDVLHSFYVPDFRIKQDVLPGRYTETWFEATKPGRYQILCAEYCGTWHSQMWGEVVVMPGPEFDAWMVEQKAGLAERVDTGGDDGGSMRGVDRRVRQEDRDVGGLPRAATRSTASRTSARPGWTSTSGARRWRTARRSIADEAYLTDSMIDPRGKVVKGFKPVMPTYKGRLAAPEAAALVEFIKSLRSTSLENLPSKEATYEPAKPSQPASDDKPVYPAVNYLNADRGRPVVAADARPQAHRRSCTSCRCC